MKVSQTDSSTGRKAVRSAFWQLLGGGWQTLVRLGASVFLARALTPEDFGVFGMALLFREFLSTIGALGMGSGIIAKKDVTQADLSTCFWTMAGVRVCLFLMAFFGAPLGGYFLGDMRVVPVLRVISFLFLTSILEVVSGTLLTKELQFGKLNIIYGVGTLFESTMAVVLAVYTDLGYWALVYAALLSSVGVSIGIFIMAGWRPSFQWSKDSFRYLMNFGLNTLGFTFVNYLSSNIDYLLVGKVLGMRAFGLYEFSYKIPFMIYSRLGQSVGAVVFPFLSKYKGDDRALVKRYISIVRSVSVCGLLALSVVFVTAEKLVIVLWGQQWVEAVAPLKILCVAAGIRIVIQPVGSLFYIAEQPSYMFRTGAASLGLACVLVPLLGYLWGLKGVAVAMVFIQFPYWLALAIGLKKFSYTIASLLSELKWVLVSVLFTSVLVNAIGKYFLLYVHSLSDFSVLAILSCLGTFVYSFCIFLFDRRMVADFSGLLKYFG